MPSKPSLQKTPILLAGILAIMLALPEQVSCAGPLRDRLKQWHAAQEQGEASAEEDEAPSGEAPLPAGVRIIRDVPYGSDRLQRFDVYLPPGARQAPVIFMVHGGGWFTGDKAARSVVENKVARWVPRGFILVSANYRLVPQADPLTQAGDVAAALAAAQDRAASWGGDRAKFILMGHSAGAHLVSLLASSPSITSAAGVTPWLGAVALDSAAFDVTRIMQAQHYRFYDRAFGDDPGYWESASPVHRLTKAGPPFLAVCSALRDDSCPQASRFVQKALSLGMRVSVVERSLSHKDINRTLGEDGPYTDAVEAFLRTLDRSIEARLTKQPGRPLAAR